MANVSNHPASDPAPPVVFPRRALSRVRWTNVTIVLSTIIFWIGVIMKILS